jgi:FMN phosphatase YigB (HAD superfamily)
MAMASRVENSKVLLIFDGDGTLYRFTKWFAKAMHIVHELAEKLHVPVDELGTELGRNMVADGTHESAYPFRGKYFAKLWGGRDHEDFVHQVTVPYFFALDHTRDEDIEAYGGINDMMGMFAMMHTMGIAVTVLSDAPMEACLQKLCRLGLHQYVGGVYAIQTRDPRYSGELIWNERDYRFCSHRVERQMELARDFNGIPIMPLPRSEEKPSTAGIRRLIGDATRRYGKVRPIVIGDNLAKDGGVAQQLGLPFIHANYGSVDREKPERRRVTDWLLNPDKRAGEVCRWHAPPKMVPPVAATVETIQEILPAVESLARVA